jgi:hypothetical protein
MDRPVQITFHNISGSPALESAIHERVAALEAYHPHIVGCRVHLDVPHRHREHGHTVHVRVEVSLPGEDVVVSHEPSVGGTLRDLGVEASTKAADLETEHRHALVAIRDAFEVARRRVQDAARRQRGDVKTREAPGLS